MSDNDANKWYDFAFNLVVACTAGYCSPTHAIPIGIITFILMRISGMIFDWTRKHDC